MRNEPGFPTIIAIAGLKGAGKDTAADWIAENYAYTKMSFATPLKSMLKVLFDFSDQQLNTGLKEEKDTRWNIAPRDALKFFGTEIMQYEINKLIPNTGKTFWSERLFNEYDRNDKLSHIVIADLRFKHEYDEIRKRGGLVIKVHRHRQDVIPYLLPGSDDHASEQEHIHMTPDYIIQNEHSKDEFYTLIGQMLEKFNDRELFE